MALENLYIPTLGSGGNSRRNPTPALAVPQLAPANKMLPQTKCSRKQKAVMPGLRILSGWCSSNPALYRLNSFFCTLNSDAIAVATSLATCLPTLGTTKKSELNGIQFLRGTPCSQPKSPATIRYPGGNKMQLQGFHNYKKTTTEILLDCKRIFDSYHIPK